jgi:hypothetical protein
MRTGAPGVILAAAAAALTLAACGSSSTSTTQQAGLSTTTSSTSSTTSSAAKPAKAHKKHKTTTHKKTSTHTTTSSKTSKTTTSTTTTTSATSKTTTSKTTTTAAALKPPLQATLVGENHTPKIGTKWSYTVTAKDANGKPLSGTIETEFAYGGAVVGKEAPFKHTFTNGSITNQVTFPPRAKGVTGLDLQVIVITSIGTKTLDWTVSPTTK